jgi:hypothetical protein
VAAVVPLTYAIWLPEGLRRHAVDGAPLVGDGELVVGSGRSAVPCFRNSPFLRPAPPNPPCALPRNGLSTSPGQCAHAGDPCVPLVHGVGILAPR